MAIFGWLPRFLMRIRSPVCGRRSEDEDGLDFGYGILNYLGCWWIVVSAILGCGMVDGDLFVGLFGLTQWDSTILCFHMEMKVRIVVV